MKTPAHTHLIEQTDKERHASWLELFFDLVFVVSISGLAKVLYQHHSLDILHYTILFLMVWWLWIGISYYADQFNIHDGVGISALFLAMFGIILLNHFLPEAFETQWRAFAIIYGGMRLLLIMLYVRAYLESPVSRALLKKYITGFSIAALCWFISIFTSKHIALWCWFLAMCIDLPTPIIAYITTANIPAQVSHMDERFGLFVIIVLGETVLTVSHTLQTISWTGWHLFAAAIGFIITLFFWRYYFKNDSENVIHTALRRQQRTLLLSFVYGYGHFFIYLAIVAFGVSVSMFIHENMNMFSPGFILSIASVIVFLLATAVVRWSSHQIK